MSMDQRSKFCPVCNRQTMWARPGTNHILHLLITCLLCGFWIPVWIMASLRVGGWCCQTCGSRGSLWERVGAPIVGVIVLVAAVGWFASRRGPGDKADSSATFTPTPIGTEVRSPATAQDVPKIEPAAIPIAKAPSKPARSWNDVANGMDRRANIASSPKSQLRTWGTKDGKFTVEAQLIDFGQGKATLKKSNGKTIVVEADKLSDADQAFLRQRLLESDRLRLTELLKQPGPGP
jgi:hypothetical protein